MDEGYADLHMHSSFSDGAETPAALVETCGKLGLRAMAITDHDSVAGLDEAFAAAARYPRLLLLPGLELDTKWRGRSVHILGYHIDRKNKYLLEVLAEQRRGREKRLGLMLAKLADLGLPLTARECYPSAAFGEHKAVGRPHLARAMVAKGYVSSVEEAFDRYLAAGKPAYAEIEKLTPKEGVALVHAAGGAAVLAHPGELPTPQLAEELLTGETAAGFDGIEVYHPNNAGCMAKWLQTAKNFHLLVSGGSDYHGIKGKIPEHLGEWLVPVSFVKKLLEWHK